LAGRDGRCFAARRVQRRGAVRYESFVLEEQDRLVLISDGILEATDSAGEPFGFERIQSVLSSNVSASAFADAAQTFGQEDDISAISVIRHKNAVFQ
jgi:serine/threonine protein phosphatase PrpC